MIDELRSIVLCTTSMDSSSALKLALMVLPTKIANPRPPKMNKYQQTMLAVLPSVGVRSPRPTVDIVITQKYIASR